MKESGGELASWPFFRGMLRPLELGNWDLCSLKLLTSHLQCLALGRWYWPGGPILACLLWAVNSVSTMLSPLHSAHVEAHGSINPSLWHLALLGKGRLFVTNVRFFFFFFSLSSCPVALWAQICQLRNQHIPQVLLWSVEITGFVYLSLCLSREGRLLSRTESFFHILMSVTSTSCCSKREEQ